MFLKSKKIAALILAAGESGRLGKPKQSLKYGNTTLLNHIKEQLNLNFVDRTFIVLGAYAQEIIERSGLKPSEYIEFKGWEEGMGSSLAYACSVILKDKNYDGILITLSDLPLVTGSDYQNMVEMFKSTSQIVATETNQTLGVPALFGKDFFVDLQKLQGDKGAKSLLLRYRNSVRIYKNERAAKDIDTPEDYAGLIDNQNN